MTDQKKIVDPYTRNVQASEKLRCLHHYDKILVSSRLDGINMMR